jgi:hypothetical protein
MPCSGPVQTATARIIACSQPSKEAIDAYDAAAGRGARHHGHDPGAGLGARPRCGSVPCLDLARPFDRRARRAEGRVAPLSSGVAFQAAALAPALFPSCAETGLVSCAKTGLAQAVASRTVAFRSLPWRPPPVGARAQSSRAPAVGARARPVPALGDTSRPAGREGFQARPQRPPPLAAHPFATRDSPSGAAELGQVNRRQDDASRDHEAVAEPALPPRWGRLRLQVARSERAGKPERQPGRAASSCGPGLRRAMMVGCWSASQSSGPAPLCRGTSG